MSQVAVPIASGMDENVVWVVSRWVRGRSLRRTLGAYRDAGQAVTYAEALGILEGVALALRELHALCPHGALYPESVQIGRDGKIVLTDVGIAASAPRARLIEHFERFPDVMAYLSPEIRGGKRPSAASDLYALGALASELLTGDPGAGAAGIAGVMMKGLPPEIDRALQGLAALKANERAAALPLLLNALARAVGERAVPQTAQLPRRRAPTDVMPAVPEIPMRGPRPRRGTPH
jgi:serine/threonine protein kinase